MQKQIPVYLFTGFLESGKTKTIIETLKDDAFTENEKTLVIICEEGEIEYDKEFEKDELVFLHYIESAEKLNKKELSTLCKKNKIDRVMIEYNGMWNLEDLYASLPDEFLLYQQLFLVDSTTFVNYNSNMRSLVIDKVKDAQLVVFNRAESADKELFHKIIRSTSRRCQIIYEYKDGSVNYDEIVDDLPFDVNADIIKIEDMDYAIWFSDFSENIKKYDGKVVEFKGIVGINKNMRAGTTICGRHVMTCCVDDIEFKGLVCEKMPTSELKNRDWVILRAKIVMKYHELYKKQGPVLICEKCEKADAPEMEVATFY